MRRTSIIISALAICMALSACGHSHTWQAANCTSPQICPECGATEGEALGHVWEDATCTASKFCTVCGLTSGNPIDHSWKDATCTAPQTCGSCGETTGAALEHTWNAATCTIPEICSVCSETQGEALGHSVDSWAIIADSTCTEPGREGGTCSVCSESLDREIPLKEHSPSDWIITVQPTPDSEGTHIRSCTVCNAELESEEFTLSDEEIEKLYKSNCKSISYDTLSRTPDDYKGEYVKFSGKVVQVCSEASSMFYYSTYRVATSGSYDNIVYIKVDNYGSGSRILEDDRITFYGKFDGLYTYTTVMGASVTIPCIIVEYID